MIWLVIRWVLSHLRLGIVSATEGYPILSFILLFLLAFYGYAHHAGAVACKKAQDKAEAGMEKKYEKIEKHTDTLSDKQLMLRLRKFQRD